MNPENIKKHRILSVIYAIMMFSALVLVFLGVTDIWANATYAYLPIITLCFFIQTYINWSTSKRTAILNLFVALIGAVACILMFFI